MIRCAVFCCAFFRCRDRLGRGVAYVCVVARRPVSCLGVCVNGGGGDDVGVRDLCLCFGCGRGDCGDAIRVVCWIGRARARSRPGPFWCVFVVVLE